MWRACSMNGEAKRCIQLFGRKTWRKEATYLTVDGRIILERILKKYDRKVWPGLI
jgi:hypothetical protein